MKNSLRCFITIYMITVYVPTMLSSFTATTKSLSKKFNQATKTLENPLQYWQDSAFGKHSTAIHEAGHAFLYTFFGHNIGKATIEFADKHHKKMSTLKALQKSFAVKPKKIVGGYVNSNGQRFRNDIPEQASQYEKNDILQYRQLQNCYIQTIISLGGIVAEQIFGAYSDLVPRDIAKIIYSDKQAKKRKDVLKIAANSHGQGDVENIHKNLSRFFEKKEFDTVIEQCYSITYKILRAHKQELEMIADLLIKKRTVSGNEINTLLQLPALPAALVNSDVYAPELTKEYATMQDYMQNRYLVGDDDANAGYFVLTPNSFSYPNLTDLKIKIFGVYSHTYL